MSKLHDLLATLDESPHFRGKQFEHICKWYLQNDPRYRTQVRRVWLWDDWPGRWGADAGIDLVAETQDRKLWAVQAKVYDPSYSITKHDVDTFLSESARPQFSYRLLIATTNRISKKAQRTVEDQEKRVGLKLLSDLAKSEVDWPSSPDRLRAPKPKPKKPRPHQREAIQAVLEGFEQHDRGQLLMACGTGKTLVALWVAEQLEGRRTLVLLPSLSLLAQTLREWTANAGREFSFLPVCSDETVRGEDHLVSHTAELALPVTTDPTEIAAFLRRRGPSVVFATYQSSPRIAEAYRLGRVPRFDLAVADEAHRCTGRVSKDFATILHPEMIGAAKRLFQTATPRYFTERVRKEAGEAEFEVASMDDEERFGPVLHSLTFGEAIQRDLLSDYQVVVVGVDEPTYKRYAERRRFVTRDGKEITDARKLAAQIALAKSQRKYDLRRTISFHGLVKRAKDFGASFPEVVEWMPKDERPKGAVWADHVTGDMPSGQRDTRLDRLRYLDGDERGLLTNARCLGEGVDVPTLDGVAFIDPRRSQVDIVQAVGRAIRKAEDKTVGTIILPVFIEETDDPAAALAASAYNPVWYVLKALRAHDEQLADELDTLRREMGRLSTGRVSVPGKIKFDLPVLVGERFVRAFEAKLVEQTTASWEFWFGLLETFVEREGHSLVPADHDEGGFSLGKWISHQRKYHKKGLLSVDRRQRLEALSEWTWDFISYRWEQGFDILRQFVEREGDARVPRDHQEDGVQLGEWVNSQRSYFRAGTLPSERAVRLEALPKWTWDPLETWWEESFECLKRFVKREGHARVPQFHEEDGFRLGQWVSAQRTYHGRGKLSRLRVARLETLPEWSWHRFRDDWSERFADLQSYVDRERHARVPRTHEEDGFRLGMWVHSLRGLYRQGRLKSDRQARLEALPGWTWSPTKERWEDWFRLLEAYVRREGHALVPQFHMEEGEKLGQWTSEQRKFYKRRYLQPERQRRLESLPRWIWDGREANWERGLLFLQRFGEREGDLLVPKEHVEEGFKLGSWVRGRRSDYKRGELSSDRIAQLEAIDGWVWDTRAHRWEQGYALLREYAERTGHACPPKGTVKEGIDLGSWVEVRRRRYKQGNTEPERIARLEALPGWSWGTSKKD